MVSPAGARAALEFLPRRLREGRGRDRLRAHGGQRRSGAHRVPGRRVRRRHGAPGRGRPHHRPLLRPQPREADPLHGGDPPHPAVRGRYSPRLLAMWDSVLLACADRSRIVPPAYRKLVVRVNGDTLPTLLVDGYAAGVWRPVDGGIEATAFHPLSAGAWEGLAAEAAALGGFLAARDPLVYRRYDHWWAKGFPAAETRVLPAG
ncbi:crosslink repair DNA glycosylase YcaQ family protein [Streptomyces sp. CS081A]|uniref:DNA glycosylase AlkZ-like family protein n=1 Tax=Streptomyces sp. CS081A TaxID=2162709 RepID=UPI0031BA0A24